MAVSDEDDDAVDEDVDDTTDGGHADVVGDAVSEDAALSVSEDASDEEAAAIAAAVSAHLARLEAEASGDGEEPTWTGRRWTFAGRIAGLDGHGRRVPDGAPTDAWTAAGRRDRF